MSNMEVKVNSESGKMSFNESDLPQLANALKTQNPMEAEAKDAALKMAGLAMSYFETINGPSLAVRSAITRAKLQSEIEHVLESPETAMKSAQYLEMLQPNPLNNKERFWKYNDLGPGTYTYLPDLVVNVNAKGELNEICFGQKPWISKTGSSPYSAVCGERKEK